MDLSKLSIEEIYELAMRDNLKAEQDAIIMYNKYINALPEGDFVRKGLEDIRDEEREHAGELYQLLFETNDDEIGDFEDGQEEVIKEKRDGMKTAKNRIRKIAKTKKYAMRVDDLINDLEGALEDEGPFENTDEAYDMLLEQIDSSLIYTSDIFDLAESYVDDSQMLEMFYEELLHDIMSQIHLDDYVKDYDEYEEDDDEYDRYASKKTPIKTASAFDNVYESIKYEIDEYEPEDVGDLKNAFEEVVWGTDILTGEDIASIAVDRFEGLWMQVVDAVEGAILDKLKEDYGLY